MNSLYPVVVAVLLVTLAASVDATEVETKKWVVPKIVPPTLRGTTPKGGRRMHSSTTSSKKSGKKNGKKSGKKSAASVANSGAAGAPATELEGEEETTTVEEEEETPTEEAEGAAAAPATEEAEGAATAPATEEAEGAAAAPATEEAEGAAAAPAPATEEAAEEETTTDGEAQDSDVCFSDKEFSFNLDDPCYDEAWGYTLADNLQSCLSELSPWFGDECRFYKAAVAQDSLICNDSLSSMVCTENYCDQTLPASLGGGLYGTDYNLSCKLSIYNCCTPREDLPMSRV